MSKQLMQELLIETIGFYDLDKRSLVVSRYDTLTCAYEDDNGKRCAVGRIMTDEAIRKLKENGHNVTFGVRELIQLYEPGILLEKWHPLLDDEHGLSFLVNIQCLHDYSCNWTKKGLSDYGENAVRNITKNFDLDLPTILAAIEKRATS